ncbi:MAG: 5-oxoprolinase subunit PxpB [Gemmatimonadota bacterium]|nr:5-oxoprolinase subunit PxpB [Gemmatimonadota bacterium]
MSTHSIIPLGDRAVTLTLGEGMSESLSSLVLTRSAQIRAAGIMGVTDIVPSYAAVGVHYDPIMIGFADLVERIEATIAADAAPLGERSEGTRHEIPVRYDGEDLEEVARRTQLTLDEVIAIHSEREYHVYVIGFVPGFAYLGPLDERLALPRRESPRKRVPAGSVAIADQQTGIYPSSTPGGWHLIGSTDVVLFDQRQQPPARLKAGDRVRFVRC